MLNLFLLKRDRTAACHGDVGDGWLACSGGGVACTAGSPSLLAALKVKQTGSYIIFFKICEFFIQRFLNTVALI